MAVILVVDDERPVREFLAVALEQGGHHVLQAYHGRHALNMLADPDMQRPDLVISDVMMPVVGGIELCFTLKADPTTTGIPLVLMSAAARHVTIESCADAYIAKPFDLDTMDALVRRMLSATATPSVDQSALGASSRLARRWETPAAGDPLPRPASWPPPAARPE